MTEEIVEDEAPLTAAEDGADSIKNSAPLADETEVTVWAPEPSAGGDYIIA